MRFTALLQLIALVASAAAVALPAAIPEVSSGDYCSSVCRDKANGDLAQFMRGHTGDNDICVCDFSVGGCKKACMYIADREGLTYAGKCREDDKSCTCYFPAGSKSKNIQLTPTDAECGGKGSYQPPQNFEAKN